MRRIYSFLSFMGFLLLAFLCPAQTSYASVVDHTEANLPTVISPSRDQKQAEASLKRCELDLQKEPDNFQVLIDAAYLHLRLGWLYSKKEQEKKHYRILLEYAKRALKQNPEDYQARLLDVIAEAKHIDYLSQSDQIHMVWKLKKELDTLRTIRSDDPDSIYVMSWLNFKVGQINSLQRFFASFLYGGVPEDLTIENAFALMKKAIALRPNYSIYSYDLGLFNQRMGQLKKANKLFEKVLASPPREPEDIVYKRWTQKRLHEMEFKKVAKD